MPDMSPEIEIELRRKHEMLSTAWRAILDLYKKPYLTEEDWADYLFIFETSYDIEKLPKEEKDFLDDLSALLFNQAERLYETKVVEKKVEKKISRREYERIRP